MSQDEEIVIEEAQIEEARHLPAVVAHEAMVTRGEITPDEVKEQRDKIIQVMRHVMVRDQHYGQIPGVNKPTLLKPGAELLAVTFRLAPHYTSERTFHDDGHLTVVSKVTLVHIPSSLTIAEGEGLCTSREKKYAYRGGGRVCPECGVAGTIKRSKFPPRSGDYDGAASTDDPGWYCYAKVGGCGANFSYHDERIASQEEKPIQNPDLADTFNTVLKMANKRALVAAILNGTAASDIFTQDVEDGVPVDEGDKAPESTERRVNQEPKVPRSWDEVVSRMNEQLGVDEALEWMTQAKELKEMGAISAQPTLLQRLSGIVLDLEAAGHDYTLMHGSRDTVRAVFAARLEGNALDGPAWCLDGSDAAELERPSKEEVLSRTAA